MKRVKFLAAASFILFALMQSLANDPDQARVGLNIGNKAPEIIESGVDVTEIKLSDAKGKIVLIDFWASWCVPCKMMSPVLNELAEEAGPNVQVCKVNVEEYQSLASKYSIRGIPTMLLFRNGKEINRYVGVKSKDFLLQEINKYN